jgi:hypothetical protein
MHDDDRAECIASIDHRSLIACNDVESPQQPIMIAARIKNFWATAIAFSSKVCTTTR